MKKEQSLSSKIAHYLSAKYPKVVYRFDLIADYKMNAKVAMAIKRRYLHEVGYPDLFIAKCKNGYGGLYLELKATNIYKKDGTLRKDKHLQEQEKMHERLRRDGYKVQFVVGFDEAVKAIDEYIRS